MAYLHFFSALSDTLMAIAVGGGYATLFTVLLLEGIPLVGIAVPGHVAIISAGFLAATGVLDPVWVLIFGCVGAIVGDYVSFLLGRIFGWSLVERLRKYFFVSERTLRKTRTFLEAHTGKALILGRFNPVTRGLMPFFVGSNRMPAKTFWIWNTLGAIAWVVSSVAIGYALGLGYHAAAAWIGRAFLIAVIGAVLIIWGYRFVNARFHIFKRYELFVVSLNVISLIGLVRMIEDAVAATPFMANFDLYVNDVVNNALMVRADTWLAATSAWVSALGGTIVIAALTILGGIALAARRRWRSAALLLMSVGTTAFFTGWLKDVIMRIRPEDFLAWAPAPGSWLHPLSFLFEAQNPLNDPSFPSGHAAFATAFFLVVAYLVAPKIRSWVRREAFIVVCVLVPLAIGLSRIVLSVHWASDVIAGWALGVFCATGSILFVRYIGTLVAGKLEEEI